MERIQLVIMNRYGGFLSHGGTPQSSSVLVGVSLTKTHHVGVPPCMEPRWGFPSQHFMTQGGYVSQMLHLWNIYLHLPQTWPKCRYSIHGAFGYRKFQVSGIFQFSQKHGIRQRLLCYPCWLGGLQSQDTPGFETRSEVSAGIRTKFPSIQTNGQPLL